nr:hypothetical protein [uncultured Desulfobulbus sp.]
MVRLMIAFFTFLLFAAPCLADGQVEGQYIYGPGATVSLQISVPRPAPAALILRQQVTGGAHLVAVRPAPVGEDLSGSALKWLFKRPRPGNFSIQMQFAAPVSPGILQGTLYYRDRATGNRVRAVVHN